MTVLVAAEHLFRYYDQHCAIEDVSFSLKKGEVMGFLGPNGAGKTTTMQMLSGNLAPSAGNISIAGIDLLEQPSTAKCQLGYLPDTPPLYRELTVKEFLRYCAQLHRLPKPEWTKALKETLDRCGLVEVADRLIGHLSKGYQQRVGIAQAILHNPAVIILDEPTIGLDPLQIREIRQLIQALGKEHGIILSTHILSEVQESCTHVHIIRQGRSMLNASIAELNRQLQASRLHIVTRVPVNSALLAQLPGVLSINGISATELEIELSRISCENPAQLDPVAIDVQEAPVVNQLAQENSPEQITERIAETIIANGWGLRALTPIKHSLEDEFIRLTRTETVQ